MRFTQTTRSALTALSIALLAALLLGGCGEKQGAGKTSYPAAEQMIIENSVTALENLSKQKGVIPFHGYLAKAKGVIIFPSLYKGSYIFGIQSGNGILLSHNANGTWSAPSFVVMSDVSFGFQAGGQVTTGMLILMEQQYVDDALSDKLTLSADISAAIGPVGHSAQLDRSTHTKGIIYAAYTQGLAFSMALESGTILINKDRNRSYYGTDATPAEIIAGTVDNSGSQGLRNKLAQYAQQAAPDIANE